MPKNETRHNTYEVRSTGSSAAPKGTDDQTRTSEAAVAAGPHVVIDGVVIEANRMTLTPLEVARVMRLEEIDVRNMIRRGALHDVSCDGKRRLDPDEVILAVEERVCSGELEAHVFVELAALIAGRL